MMRLALLTALTMTAFAANSILNRLAVDSGAIAPDTFAAIRVGAGAVVLSVLVLARQGNLPLLRSKTAFGAVALSLYMIGFSLAYRTLDAGLGALILFGGVQIFMFAWSALSGTPATLRQYLGAGAAFTGLAIALWPGANAVADLRGGALMVLAALGWAAYTLAGRSQTDPLAGTAANFCLSLPIVLLLPLAGTGGAATGLADMTTPGIALAVLSGAMTSGLGYALWYAILPRLDAAVAAVVQLSVPVIAIAGGALLLGEAATLRVLVGAAFVLGGIALVLRRAEGKQ